MQYLSVLLAQPNTTFPVTVCVSARSRLNVAVMNGSSGETLDAEALKSLRERAADIAAEMETARDENDDARVRRGF